MYRYVRVDSDLDRQDWLRTRQSVYLGSGVITPDDLTDGVYQDTFDARCHHLLACDQDGEPVGSARLIVRNGDAAPLHLEGHFAVDIEPSSAEISGFTIVPGHRASELLAGLFRAVYELGREQQVTWLYAVVEPPFLRAIQRAGFPFKAVTEPKWIYNPRRRPHQSPPRWHTRVSDRRPAWHLTPRRTATLHPRNHSKRRSAPTILTPTPGAKIHAANSSEQRNTERCWRL
jgi:Acetyltransferase (GNAT) domain